MPLLKISFNWVAPARRVLSFVSCSCELALSAARIALSLAVLSAACFHPAELSLTDFNCQRSWLQLCARGVDICVYDNMLAR
jgi:hypothetical protein